MHDIGGIELSDMEVKVLKEQFAKLREEFTDEEIIEQATLVIRSDEDPAEWARQILADLDAVDP
jgi:hypothetical protein